MAAISSSSRSPYSGLELLYNDAITSLTAYLPAVDLLKLARTCSTLKAKSPYFSPCAAPIFKTADLLICFLESVTRISRAAQIPLQIGELNLSRYRYIWPEQFDRMIGLCPGVKKIQFPPFITDDWLIQVLPSLRNARSLRSLSLDNCTYLTDRSIVAIAEACPALLDFSFICGGITCGGISDPGLIALSKACRFLRALDLSGCAFLTEVGIGELAKNCGDLHTLHLRTAAAVVTDRVIEVLATHGTRLRVLDVAYSCYHLTEGSLRLLLENCKTLQILVIGNGILKHLNKGTIPALTEQFKHVSIQGTLWGE